MFRFQQPDQEPVCLVSIHMQVATVQAQEYIGREERDTLFSVDERVVHDE
jgi:hypothetical protein